ncbi:signal peptidase I, partial [uncultured Enorma sp.]|uniref:signal peptidase I n=1 Tax=uncultured Enorma sp. TaxID=1714346 RepID=UPI002600F162
MFFIFIRMFVIEPYRVPTGSMEPTIEVGDQVFAQKLTVNLGMDVSVSDIVVFKNPDGDADHDIL